MACWISVPWPETEPRPQQWKHWNLLGHQGTPITVVLIYNWLMIHGKYLFIYLSATFFAESCVQILCLFFNCILSLFCYCWLLKVLYKFVDISPLSGMCFVKISSQFVACLSDSISFCFLLFNKVQLTNFFPFIRYSFYAVPRKLPPDLTSPRFSPILPSSNFIVLHLGLWFFFNVAVQLFY